jgi:serine/threonine protein kinase
VYNHKADVWSIGCCFYLLLFGFYPFEAEGIKEMRNLMKREGIYGIPKTRKLTAECIEFLKRCLQFDPVKRSSMKELLESHYLAQSDCHQDLSK